MRRGAPLARLLALALALGVAPLAAQEPPAIPAQPAPDPLTAEAPLPQNIPAGQLPARMIESPGGNGQPVMAPVLVVDQDALFLGSAWGQRLRAESEEEADRLQAENDRLSAQLSAEEAQLTERRKEMEPAEFRRLAEAFDARATTIRRERAQVFQELNARIEADRNAFYQAARPVMGEIMLSRGAVAVLDRRTVLVSLDAIDITDDLIARLDATLSDGSDRDGGEDGTARQDGPGNDEEDGSD